MLTFRDVNFTYEKDRPVLRGVSFSVREGEAVGLIGANGAGKSTVLMLLTGLLAGEGEITVDGLPVTREHLAEIRSRIGFVMQDSDSQMFMPTVLEDMLFGPMNYGLSREEAERRADEVLARLDLAALKTRHNHRISGGEKRMAAIATVLTMAPKVLLLDEPTSALDPMNRRRVIRTLNELRETKLITSHDLDMIYDTCSRVLVLKDGRIAADGPAEEILKDAALLADCRLELPLRFQ